eukprot:scaffold5885_cov201-Amphora_coffeaeformis.AAC.25
MCALAWYQGGTKKKNDASFFPGVVVVVVFATTLSPAEQRTEKREAGKQHAFGCWVSRKLASISRCFFLIIVGERDDAGKHASLVGKMHGRCARAGTAGRCRSDIG